MCGVWFGGHGVGTFMIGCRRARAMPPPFQLPYLCWLEMVLRMVSDNLNEAVGGLPSGASMGG